MSENFGNDFDLVQRGRNAKYRSLILKNCAKQKEKNEIRRIKNGNKELNMKQKHNIRNAESVYFEVVHQSTSLLSDYRSSIGQNLA